VKTHSKAIRNAYGRAAHSHDIKVLMGFRAQDKLPWTGQKPFILQGVKVYIRPLEGEALRDSSWAYGRAYRRMNHRVRAICPLCEKDLSAGRLNQHLLAVHPE